MLVARPEAPRERPVSGPAAFPAIVTVAGGAAGSGAVFPDLRGLGARDAPRVLVGLGVAPRLQGVGIVVEQDPAAGSPIGSGAVATLRLERTVIPEAAPVPAADVFQTADRMP